MAPAAMPSAAGASLRCGLRPDIGARPTCAPTLDGMSRGREHHPARMLDHRQAIRARQPHPIPSPGHEPTDTTPRAISAPGTDARPISAREPAVFGGQPLHIDASHDLSAADVLATAGQSSSHDTPTAGDPLHVDHDLVPNRDAQSAPETNGVVLCRRDTGRLQELRGVELAGLEPATSWVRSRRSPN